MRSRSTVGIMTDSARPRYTKKLSSWSGFNVLDLGPGSILDMNGMRLSSLGRFRHEATLLSAAAQVCLRGRPFPGQS